MLMIVDEGILWIPVSRVRKAQNLVDDGQWCEQLWQEGSLLPQRLTTTSQGEVWTRTVLLVTELFQWRSGW
jgi:hypothetical protein